MNTAHERRHQYEEWLTPKWIIDALGPFDLDPCAPTVRPWPTAEKHYTVLDDGLSLPWAGRVWLNPPYGKRTSRWLWRMTQHGDGIALVFARTETAMFQDLVFQADALLFVRGRIEFCKTDGTGAGNVAGAPSVLAAFGADNADRLRRCGIVGRFVDGSEVSDGPG